MLSFLCRGLHDAIILDSRPVDVSVLNGKEPLNEGGESEQEEDGSEEDDHMMLLMIKVDDGNANGHGDLEYWLYDYYYY